MTAVAEHPAEPLVSVLIPAKDVAQWIPEQLAALDDQVDAPPLTASTKASTCSLTSSASSLISARGESMPKTVTYGAVG